jgi:hypothetical protein
VIFTTRPIGGIMGDVVRPRQKSPSVGLRAALRRIVTAMAAVAIAVVSRSGGRRSCGGANSKPKAKNERIAFAPAVGFSCDALTAPPKLYRLHDRSNRRNDAASEHGGIVMLAWIAMLQALIAEQPATPPARRKKAAKKFKVIR